MCLKGGQTSHTTFRLILDTDESAVCNMNLNTPYAAYMKQIRIIIWDKITMATKYAFKIVHNFLTYMHGNKKPFGNVIMVLSGDSRQTVPIVKHGSRSQIMENTVKKNSLWICFERCQLYHDQRVNDNNQEFKDWLLNINDDIFA